MHAGDDGVGTTPGEARRLGKKCPGLGQEEHHASSDGGARAPGGGASAQPNGRPRKVTYPEGGRHSVQADIVGGPLPSFGDARGRLKSRPVVRSPGRRAPSALQVPQNPTFITLGARARLLERLFTGGAGGCEQNGRLTAEPRRSGAPLPPKPPPALPPARSGGSGSRIPLFRFRFPEG